MFFKKTTLAAACLVGLASGATLDVTNKAALGDATHKAVSNLVSLYSAEKQAGKTTEGAFDQSNVSWYVSGIIWGMVFDNSHYNGDRAQDTVAGSAMLEATFKETGDLLGGAQRTIQEKLRGKWNDDLGWWSLSMMSAVEAYDKNVFIPGGAKFVDVAALTWNEILEQWDETTCNGGIYWSRNREDPSANKRTFKSVITHSQFVELGARLAIATGNTTYLNWSDKVYNWMKTSGLVTADWAVLDGANAPTCTQVDRTEWSYNAGTLMGALAYMYKATKMGTYLDDAKKLLPVAIGKFTQNGIINEPVCTTTPALCGRDTPASMPQFGKGLSQLYIEGDAAMKQQIQTVIDTTLASAIRNCNNDWWCNKEWQQTAAPAQDVYNQYPTAELLVAASAIHGASAPAGTQNGLPSGPSSASNNNSNSKGTGASGALGGSPAGLAWAAGAAVAAGATFFLV
ncbi:hypothetical protein SpCBS45565_g06900 [Spizellomyces sp. 'palustris']|nr:hypothetical protein SpCBS45565_g06900 [Spizellomyces sp. 'palustris']